MRVFVALLAGAALTLAGATAYYTTGDHFANDRIELFNGENMQLVAGTGAVDDDNAIIVEALGEPGGEALISSAQIRLDAGIYTEVEWQFAGPLEQLDISVLWATRRDPQQLKSTPLPLEDGSTGRLRLTEVDGWEDFIGAIGLRISGDLTKPLTVRALSLRLATPTPFELLAALWGQWTAPEGWEASSINFVAGGVRAALFPAVLAVAIWIGLSWAVYAALAVRRGRPWSIKPYAACVLVGWIALDARWGWDLWRQLQTTYEQFAGKSWDEKRLADIDGDLFEFIQQIEAVMPPPPVRVFLADDGPPDTTKFRRFRTRFHLLPHNVYPHVLEPAQRESIRSGDYLLVFVPVPDMNYDTEKSTLVWDGKSMAVELAFSNPMGSLFRLP